MDKQKEYNNFMSWVNFMNKVDPNPNDYEQGVAGLLLLIFSLGGCFWFSSWFGMLLAESSLLLIVNIIGAVCSIVLTIFQVRTSEFSVTVGELFTWLILSILIGPIIIICFLLYKLLVNDLWSKEIITIKEETKSLDYRRRRNE
jgi:hypothetical protein